MEFQKNIIICWMQGQEHLNLHPKSKLFNENLKNWSLLNPEWHVQLLTDQDFRQACTEFSPECLKIYDSFEILHLKVDFGRYVYLYLHGGIYVDMDMFVLRSLSFCDQINYLLEQVKKGKHVLGISLLNVDFWEALLFVDRSQYLNNAVMVSTAKNPLLFLFIQSIIMTVNNRIAAATTPSSSSTSAYTTIQSTTGPITVTNFFSNFIDNPVATSKYCIIEIFPTYLFEPSPPVGLSDIREGTIAIHKTEKSWIDKKRIKLINFYYYIKPIVVPIIIIPVLSYALVKTSVKTTSNAINKKVMKYNKKKSEFELQMEWLDGNTITDHHVEKLNTSRHNSDPIEDELSGDVTTIINTSEDVYNNCKDNASDTDENADSSSRIEVNTPSDSNSDNDSVKAASVATVLVN